MNPLSVFDIVASVNVGQISELDSQVVSGNYKREETRLVNMRKKRYAIQSHWQDSPLFKAILPSSTSSDERQMRTVSFLFFPLIKLFPRRISFYAPCICAEQADAVDAFIRLTEQ